MPWQWVTATLQVWHACYDREAAGIGNSARPVSSKMWAGQECSSTFPAVHDANTHTMAPCASCRLGHGDEPGSTAIEAFSEPGSPGGGVAGDSNDAVIVARRRGTAPARYVSEAAFMRVPVHRQCWALHGNIHRLSCSSHVAQQVPALSDVTWRTQISSLAEPVNWCHLASQKPALSNTGAEACT
jgi:hypothetical protein